MKLPKDIRAFFDDYAGATPHLVVSLDVVKQKFLALKSAMPNAHHHYAIKANPHPEILKVLAQLGAYFECASIPEIDMCLLAGAKPSEILYGNPIKKTSEIQQAYARGVTQYVFDSEMELGKLIKYAPGSKVICRIVTDGAGAISPLSIKFGAPASKATAWLLQAHQQGLIAHGVSFHTGSQQLQAKAWLPPIQVAADIFSELKAQGINSMAVLDIGGGFPVTYRENVPSITDFCSAINNYINDAYGEAIPLVYTEPGRYMAGDAGFIVAEVVLVSPCHVKPDNRWVYLDIGRYGGLVEAKIDYPIVSQKDGPTGVVMLAGQTCDSNDVIYNEDFGYQLPLSLESGDRVILAHTGVYTTTYSTTLNGFPTLSSQCI